MQVKHGERNIVARSANRVNERRLTRPFPLASTIKGGHRNFVANRGTAQSVLSSRVPSASLSTFLVCQTRPGISVPQSRFSQSRWDRHATACASPPTKGQPNELIGYIATMCSRLGGLASVAIKNPLPEGRGTLATRRELIGGTPEPTRLQTTQSAHFRGFRLSSSSGFPLLVPLSLPAVHQSETVSVACNGSSVPQTQPCKLQRPWTQ